MAKKIIVEIYGYSSQMNVKRMPKICLNNIGECQLLLLKPFVRFYYWPCWLLERLRDTSGNLLIPEKH